MRTLPKFLFASVLSLLMSQPVWCKETETEQSIVEKNLDLTFWTSIQNSDDPDELREYLKQFPQGTFAGLAKLRIKKLEPPVETIAEENKATEEDYAGEANPEDAIQTQATATSKKYKSITSDDRPKAGPDDLPEAGPEAALDAAATYKDPRSKAKRKTPSAEELKATAEQEYENRRRLERYIATSNAAAQALADAASAAWLENNARSRASGSGSSSGKGSSRSSRSGSRSSDNDDEENSSGDENGRSGGGGSGVCNCKGYSGPGGPCYDGPGGPCYDGPGGGSSCPAVCQ